MLFGTGPSSGSTAGPSSHTYSPYSHSSVAAGQQPQFKALHPSLMNSMLHASNPTTGPSQLEMISSLNYHHGHSLEAVGQVARTPSAGDSKSGGAGSRDSPSAHRAQNVSPSSSSSGVVHSGSQNEVRNVMLYNIPIVSLVMDGQERLCLAQISNTLLKTFSYNEIHNRRVALGITCVQCTPVQLELLRRAGAMPVSSRRCGMITKREAERLCKSFLAEAEPPKLPETFSFDVYHACAWGCRGSFTPSRYNSSRAKCIKCVYCGLFFSPNKFIFHSHRLPTSKYVQPDAANFNSWRRHIRLVSSPEPAEHVSFAWEDVKAMFNGGSRKRAMTTTLNSFTKNQESHSKANAAHKQAQRYKYSDDNSGLEDSDEYCSLDGPPGKKASGNDSEGNTSSQQDEEHSPHAVSHHSYHSFSQINSKSIFENHFKKAFEVSSLIGNGGHVGQLKSMEGKEQQPMRSPTRSSPLVPSPMKPIAEPIEPKVTDMMNSASYSPIESYLESTKNGVPPTKPIPQSVVPPPGSYLAHPGGSEHASLMASYNGLFGGHHFGRQHQLTDPRMAGAHPAILSTLLNGVPESAANHHQLRSGLLSSNYMQMAPSMMAPTANSSTPDLMNQHANSTGPQADFRHNLAEFMWSMASKAGPTPYNFLWPHTGVHPQMSSPMGGSSLPLGTSQSSSSSSTPTLSPNQVPPSNDALQESVNGNLFGFKPTTNADEIRKALLLNTNLLHQQRNAAASHFSSLHPNTAGMPFLPNLIGHNLRLMPSNGNHNPTTMAPNYLLNKENTEIECVSTRNKSPDMMTSHQASSLPTMPTPLFPFRSAFTSPATGGAPLDRCSEALLRNQLLFDAYHGGNPLSSRSLFNPNFNEKPRFEDNSSDSGADKSIDVIGDDGDPHAVFKSMYHPIAYSKSSSRSNGPFKLARRNLKRSLDSDSKSSSKKVASIKAKSPRKKSNDNLLLEVDSEMSTNKNLKSAESESLRARPQTGDSTAEDRNQERSSEMERCSNSQDEVSCDVENRSAVESPVQNPSQSPREDTCAALGGRKSSPSPLASTTTGQNGKMFMLLNDTGHSQTSSGSQTIQLVS